MKNIKDLKDMKVTLLNYTPLWVCSQAIRTCWQSHGNSDTQFDGRGNPYWVSEGMDGLDEVQCGIGPKDKELIDRIGNKFKHASTLEHLYYNFRIENVSRALLQEICRHRVASPSVKSTRYTLKELKKEESFEKSYTTYVDGVKFFDIDTARLKAAKYLVFTGNDKVDKYSIYALENLRKLIADGVPNDEAKYALPESYKVELAWSINARSLQNFIHLRSSKAALLEIRELAQMVYEALPEDHKYLFSLNKEE